MRHLQAISRTVRPLERTMPGISDKFRVPHNQSDQGMLAAAHAAAQNALPIQAELIKRGLPANFLADLQADIEQFEEAITNKAQIRETHVEATAAHALNFRLEFAGLSDVKRPPGALPLAAFHIVAAD